MERFFSFGSDFVAPLRKAVNKTQAELEKADGPSTASQNDTETGRRIPGPEAAMKYRIALDTVHPEPLLEFGDGTAFTPGELFQAAWSAMNDRERTPLGLTLDQGGERFTVAGVDQNGLDIALTQPRHASTLTLNLLSFSDATAEDAAELVIARATQYAPVQFQLGGSLGAAISASHNRRILQFARPDLAREGVASVVIDPLWQIRSLDEANNVLRFMNDASSSHIPIPDWAPMCVLAAARAAWEESEMDPHGHALSVGGDHPSPLQFLGSGAIVDNVYELTANPSIFKQGPAPWQIEEAVTYLTQRFARFHGAFLGSLISHRDERALSLTIDAVRTVQSLTRADGEPVVVITPPNRLATTTVLAAAVKSAFQELGQTCTTVITDPGQGTATLATPLDALDHKPSANETARIVFSSNELTITALGDRLYAQHHTPLLG